MKVSWGAAIAGVYTLFALSTAGFVAFAMSRPVDLVRPDYYAESLRQDERMQAAANAEGLDPAALVREAGRSIEIALPSALRPVRGTITLYRPSNAAADRHVDLSLDADGRQRVAMQDAAAGLWIVQLAWTSAGREFYVERPISLR
ncbi:MAG TPA: FixH family protein [Vicinamibacterales bacterium]|nr:FixH family protein [Vicinamibacterales bacterium]